MEFISESYFAPGFAYWIYLLDLLPIFAIGVCAVILPSNLPFNLKYGFPRKAKKINESGTLSCFQLVFR